MKITSKNSYIGLTLMILVLVFLCSFNAVYSYFTANASKDGDFTFSNLETTFILEKEDGDTIPVPSGGQFEVYPASGSIGRGVTFSLQVLSGSTKVNVANVNVESHNDSCPSYVALWVDAYEVDAQGNDITTTNYGEYFMLGFGSSMPVHGVTNDSIGPLHYNATKNVYYLKAAVETYTACFNKMQLSDAAPMDLMGKNLSIYVSLKSVQQANNAYLTEFGDLGYYAGWAN